MNPATITEERQVLLSISTELSLSDNSPYQYFKFQVSEGASRVGLILSLESPEIAQIPIALYDPRGVLRGILVNNPQAGQINDEFWIAPDETSKGGMPGELPAGEWTAQIFVRRLQQNLICELQAYAEFGNVPDAVTITYPEGHIVNDQPGWYKGELHSHSDHSTGQTSLETVVQAAKDCDYDFLSITDHLTISHWKEVAALAKNDEIVLLRAAEIAGHYGHANIHGVRQWIDPFVDRADWGMNQVADTVHKQGGLFCINHPISGRLGWRYEEFDWEKADLYEIYCLPEGPNNNLNAAVWDRHLVTGQKLVGIGSSDSHNPFLMPLWKLGQIVNWVYADELSEQGVIDGLRRGIVYASRGPEIRFTAVNEAQQHAEMWESLPLDGGEVTFQVKIRSSPKAHLFVIKNGYSFDEYVIEEADTEWQTVTFCDKPLKSAYYRLELHRYKKSSTYIGITWRNHKTMLVLSNPIWVGRDQIEVK